MEIKTEEGVWFTRLSWDKPGTDAVFMPKKGSKSLSKHFHLERDADAYILEQIVATRLNDLQQMLLTAANHIKYLQLKLDDAGIKYAKPWRVENLLTHPTHK